MFYLSEERGAIADLGYWVRSPLMSGNDLTVLSRERGVYRRIKSRYPKMQICFAENSDDVETVVRMHHRLQKVFYTRHAAKNIHVLRFAHVKHIFIGTKETNWTRRFDKSYRAYDEIWLEEEFMIQRLREDIGDMVHLKIRLTRDALDDYHRSASPRQEDVFAGIIERKQG